MKRRRHPRLPVNIEAWLTWTDQTGHQRRVAAKCLDISMSGACVEFPIAMRPGQRLTIGVPRIPLEATAVVRRTEKRGARFKVAIEFTARRLPGVTPKRAGPGA